MITVEQILYVLQYSCTRRRRLFDFNYKLLLLKNLLVLLQSQLKALIFSDTKYHISFLAIVMCYSQRKKN